MSVWMVCKAVSKLKEARGFEAGATAAFGGVVGVEAEFGVVDAGEAELGVGDAGCFAGGGGGGGGGCSPLDCAECVGAPLGAGAGGKLPLPLALPAGEAGAGREGAAG